MAVNTPTRDNELVPAAVAWLRERLPPGWIVEVAPRSELATDNGRPDSAIEIRGTQSYTTLAVEARRTFGPRDVDRLLGGLGRTLRLLSPSISILVIAHWLSARTQARLRAENVNYIDLTGNALVRIDNPALYIEARGASRDPSPSPRGRARVRGPKAGRLVRMLIDARPPYGVGDLAAATYLTPGYVSRLLASLDEEALIERSRRGQVESVDLDGLLRRWADTYDVFTTNEIQTFLAPLGAARSLAQLGKLPSGDGIAVTGSFAAIRLSPVAAPALLCLYCDKIDVVAAQLSLIPADEGANVVLLRPFDDVVWARSVEMEGVSYVAPSQTAIDCLTGNGRMPSEGEALIGWMLDNEPAWRLDSL